VCVKFTMEGLRYYIGRWEHFLHDNSLERDILGEDAYYFVYGKIEGRI
jgi:hypothetical protein